MGLEEAEGRPGKWRRNSSCKQASRAQGRSVLSAQLSFLQFPDVISQSVSRVGARAQLRGPGQFLMHPPVFSACSSLGIPGVPAGWEIRWSQALDTWQGPMRCALTSNLLQVPSDMLHGRSCAGLIRNEKENSQPWSWLVPASQSSW